MGARSGACQTACLHSWDDLICTNPLLEGEAPVASGIVRAVNGPGLQMVTPLEDDTCEIVWLMDCEYKGMMLQKIVDVAMPMAQTSYIECVKELAANLKKEGKF